MNNQGPHLRGTNLQLGQVGGLKWLIAFLEICRFHIDIHCLECHYKLEPSVDQYVIIHKNHGNTFQCKQIVQVGHDGPETVAGQHWMITAYHMGLRCLFRKWDLGNFVSCFQLIIWHHYSTEIDIVASEGKLQRYDNHIEKLTLFGKN